MNSFEQLFERVGWSFAAHPRRFASGEMASTPIFAERPPDGQEVIVVSGGKPAAPRGPFGRPKLCGASLDTRMTM